MPRYLVTVFERVVVECQYEIEADDAEEASKLAMDGLYDSREELRSRDEAEPQREVYGEPERQDDDQ